MILRSNFEQETGLDPMNISNIMHYVGYLEDKLSTKNGRSTIPHNKIVQFICDQLGVKFYVIVRMSRLRSNVDARRVIINCLNECTEMILEDIGSVLNRDHATIIYAVKTKHLIEGKYLDAYNRTIEKFGKACFTTHKNNS